MYVNNKKYRTVAIKMTPRASTATCEILFRIPYILYTNNDPNAKQFEFGNLYIYIYIYIYRKYINLGFAVGFGLGFAFGFGRGF